MSATPTFVTGCSNQNTSNIPNGATSVLGISFINAKTLIVNFNGLLNSAEVYDANLVSSWNLNVYSNVQVTSSKVGTNMSAVKLTLNNELINGQKYTLSFTNADLNNPVINFIFNSNPKPVAPTIDLSQEIKDSNLLNGIISQLSNYIFDKTKIHESDLLNVTSLTLSNLGIISIQGLNIFSNLQILDLSDNSITNISVLDKLNNLQSLNIANDINVVNYSVLANLPKLINLNLSGLTQLNDTNNQLWNTLVKLTNLKELAVNNISNLNIDFLIFLPNLLKLSIENSDVSDFNSIRLQTNLISLNLSNNINIKNNTNINILGGSY